MKLPTKPKKVYMYEYSDQVVVLMGTISRGLTAVLFEDSELADQWIKESGHAQWDRLEVSLPKPTIVEVIYNPDLENA